MIGDVLLTSTFRQIVTLRNRQCLQRINIIISILINAFTIWACTVYYTDRREQVLASNITDEYEYWKYLRMLV